MFINSVETKVCLALSLKQKCLTNCKQFWIFSVRIQNLNNEVLLPNGMCLCSRIEMSIDVFYFLKMLKPSGIKVTVTGETVSFCLWNRTFFVSFSLISLTLEEMPWCIITVSYLGNLCLTIQQYYSFFFFFFCIKVHVHVLKCLCNALCH